MRAIEDLLKDPLDMQMMLLGAATATPSRGDWQVDIGVPGGDPRCEDSPEDTLEAAASDLEILLETYVLQFEQFADDVRKLQRKISTTHQSLQLVQSHQRNNLIQTEVNITVGALALSFALIVPSLFGMNLVHGYEEVDQSMFWGVAAATCTGGAGVFAFAKVRWSSQSPPLALSWWPAAVADPLGCRPTCGTGWPRRPLPRPCRPVAPMGPFCWTLCCWTPCCAAWATRRGAEGS